MDCGSGSLSKFLSISSVDRLDAVLLSHLHYDHMADLGCLQYSVNHAMRVGLRNSKLPVYMPQTPETMWKMVQYPYSNSIALSDEMRFTVAGINIQTKKVDHTIECYAFRLEREKRSVVYFSDTTCIPDAHEFIRGADLLLCEATITNGSRHSTGLGHMSDFEAGVLAKKAV